MGTVKQLIWILADLLGINAYFRRRNKNAIPILMYHGVTDYPLPYFCWTVLAKEKFIEQMNYLKEQYDVISLKEAVTMQSASARPAAAITFDDGLLNTYLIAWPILKAKQLSATVFVVPQLSEQGKQIWADQILQWLTAHPEKPVDLSKTEFGILPAGNIDDRVKRVDTILTTMKMMPETARLATMNTIAAAVSPAPLDAQSPFALMTQQQIQELAQSNEFAIAAHTNTHPILSRQSQEEQKQEIFGSIERLKQWNIPVSPIFAYPNGRVQDFTAETETLVQQAGCIAAVSTIDGLHTPSDAAYRIKRINIGGDISLPEFKARLSGLYYALTS